MSAGSQAMNGARAVALAGLVLTSVILGAPRSASGTPVQAAKPFKTQVVDVRPVGPEGHLLSSMTVRHRFGGGSCQLGSNQVGGIAYRCFATNHNILDPCWVQNTKGHFVICLLEPWAHGVYRMKVTKGFTDYGGAGPKFKYPWGVILPNRWRCLKADGATGDVDGKGISYFCGHKTVLLDEPNTSHATWTIATAHSVGHGRYALGSRINIAKAWFGKPTISP
jgi:hypothetical protein